MTHPSLLTLSNWLRRLFFGTYALAVVLNVEAATAGGTSAGNEFFQQNCALCHDIGSGTSAAGRGPSLAGVFGRKAASLPDFPYSQALRASNLVWDTPTLDRFLTNPTEVVPGTTMVASVPEAAARQALIAYLQTLPKASRPVQKPVEQPTGPRSAASMSGDWRSDAPGVSHRVRIEELPAPFATSSAGNGPKIVDRPPAAKLAVPAGFTIEAFATGLKAPRALRVAPNGDIFVAETAAGRVRVLRARAASAAVAEDTLFAEKLRGPFGVAFYPAGPDPRWLYVACLNSVVRFPYRNGDLAARGAAETVVPQLSETTNGHSTRDIAFSADGKRLFISVGSGSNVAERISHKTPGEIRTWEATHGLGAAWDSETNRADILQTDPEGKLPLRTYATGIRNGVGIAIQPGTGDLWVSTNERDGLGDDLVPDYITSVREGGYYGWPWYYLGGHEDPRLAGRRPDLAGKAIVPDVLVHAHSASLQLTFYPDISGPGAFPDEYRGEIFAALHGSWNRATRTGNKVIRVRMKNGRATGDYEDFVTGFVVDNGSVWGRPVGVAVARDGALLVSDDASNTVWRVSRVNSADGGK